VKIVCKSGDEAAANANNVVISRRRISLNITATTTLLLSNLADAYKLGGCYKANAAILEADDDEELLEKVKKDRKKRLEKQGVIGSSTTETAYLQDLVYKLSETGQALETNDLSAAYSVLGSSKDTEWVQRANSALNKLSSSNEEKTEVDAFNSSLVSLISSVSGNDIEGSKVAFVSCASALEKWTVLSGLVEQLKGL
ncbi:thylakoid lumenal 16.5 kDa protein, partial [Striga asiatica]